MKIQFKREAIAAVVAAVMISAGTGSMAAGSVSTEAEPVAAGITVPKVSGLADDFINGADFSTILSLEDSGVTFKNFDGQEADLFDVLADAGINYARIRVWNDPFLSTDVTKGYGAGNVDANRATIIGQRATAAGMKVLVNFHYSDFWAHPGQQYSPKEWRTLNNEDRATALYDYTAQTLQQMADAGVDIGMVQIGNETTAGEIAGVKGWANTAPLFQAGSQAVRDTLGPDVKVAVHFTNPERAGQYASAAKELHDRGVEYDVFFSSYYAYWHGSRENLTAVLDHVATTYDKEVAVVETSWGYTLEDGDGTTNSITADFPQYSTSVQGQALALRDVMQAVANVQNNKGLGTFYWEPAWLPVGPPSDYDKNWELWQRDGSGWATSYSQGFYDPEGKLNGKWADDFGGSGWDNQALFAHDGTPLESLRVYEYARTGSIAPREVDVVSSPRVTVLDGDPITLPASVTVSYTDGTTEKQEVQWRQSADWISGTGTYIFTGIAISGLEVQGEITVLSATTDGTNHIQNPGFESGVSPWTGTGTGYTISKAENPSEGIHATHFYSGNPFSFSIEQEIANVPPGIYRLSAKVQGEGKGTTHITVSSGISSLSADFELKGYLDWQTPQTDLINVAADGVVTVSASFDLSAGAWGTIDEFSLVAQETLEESESSKLKDLVAKTAEVNRDRFTAASLGVLDQALVRTEFVLNAPLASQSSIDHALESLATAFEGLELIDQGVTPTPPPVGPETDPVDPGTHPSAPGPEQGVDHPETDLDTDDSSTVAPEYSVLSDTDDSSLPQTGTNPLALVAGAGILFALGAAFVLRRVRKRANV